MTLQCLHTRNHAHNYGCLLHTHPDLREIDVNRCKFRNFRENFIFTNSVKKHICDVKKLGIGYDLPTSVNDSDFAISQCFYFHETSHPRENFGIYSKCITLSLIPSLFFFCPKKVVCFIRLLHIFKCMSD